MPEKCFDHNSVANNSLKLSSNLSILIFVPRQVEERTRTTGDLISRFFSLNKCKIIANIKTKRLFGEGTFFLEVFA